MDAEAGAEDSLRCAELDTTVPHSARIWNYWLGGKDNFAVEAQRLADIADWSAHRMIEIRKTAQAVGGIRGGSLAVRGGRRQHGHDQCLP